jgi:ATP-dependent DNA helicase RecG
MDVLSILQQLNSTDENHQIEAKQGSAVDKSLLETVCAFANEPDLGGGTILLGVVKEEGVLFPCYKVVGVTNPDKISQDIASQCAASFNIPIRPRIETHFINGKSIIGVFVSEATSTEKPIFFPKMGLPRGAYRRVGSTDQHCTEDDLPLFFGSRNAEAYDTSIVPGADMTDIDVEALAYYRKAREKVNATAEELQWNDEELLKALFAVANDGKGLRPTVTGMLLFGTRQGLRRLFPMMRVDYIRVPGKEWIANPDDRFVTVDMRGPLLQLVQRVQSAIADDLPKGFVLPEGEVQAKTPSLSTRVLREAIVNALMHRSYKSHSPIQVIRYNNRLEIRNPGYSLKAEEQLGEPGSQNRNPHLAAVFHETNIAETKGSGIRTMRRLMHDAGFAPPTFESDRRNDSFTTLLLLQHFLSAEDVQWLSLYDKHRLNEGQKKAMIFLRETGAIDNPTYRQINGVDTFIASKDLRAMRMSDLLEMKGQSTATYYVTGVAYHVGTQAALSEQQPLTDGRQPLTKAAEPLTNGAEPLTNEVPPLTLGEDTFVLQEELASLISKLGKKTSDVNVRRIIIALCEQRPFSAAQLGSILNRSTEGLRNRFLTPLLNSGELVYTIPSNPSHPKQAYRVPIIS